MGGVEMSDYDHNKYCEDCGDEIDGQLGIDICDSCWNAQFEFDDDDDGIEFADPYGPSSLFAATPEDPRNQTCPQCRSKNALTKRDVAAHHVCDQCACQNAAGW
jgi:hypothetical protein